MWHKIQDVFPLSKITTFKNSLADPNFAFKNEILILEMQNPSDLFLDEAGIKIRLDTTSAHMYATGVYNLLATGPNRLKARR